MTNLGKIRKRLVSRGVSEDEITSLTDDNLNAVKRPGVYEGNHFFDLGDTLLWQTGRDTDRCGKDNWFEEKKKPGDHWERIGTCPSGLDWYRITLVS
jgi:hypothetical protein